LRITSLLFALCLASTAFADGEAPAWAGSNVGLSQTVTTRSFDRSADLTYNPYTATGLSLAPRWKLHKKVRLSASLGLRGEWTRSDGDVRRLWWGSSSLRGDFPELVTVPGAKIGLSPYVSLGLSPGTSRAAGEVFGSGGAGLGLSRSFEPRDDLAVSLGADAYASFPINGAQYGGVSHVLLCPAGAADCSDSPIFGASSNVSWQVGASLSASLTYAKKLTVSAAGGISQSALYPLGDDTRISYVALNPAVARHAAFAQVAAGYALSRRWRVGLTAQSAHGQLGADGQRPIPLFNRYARLVGSLRMSLGNPPKKKGVTPPAGVSTASTENKIENSAPPAADVHEEK
jgi:hypothetical protein